VKYSISLLSFFSLFSKFRVFRFKNEKKERKKIKGLIGRYFVFNKNTKYLQKPTNGNSDVNWLFSLLRVFEKREKNSQKSQKKDTLFPQCHFLKNSTTLEQKFLFLYGREIANFCSKVVLLKRAKMVN